ncbi:MAG TPA: hemolysin family protein [Bacilli bacterium]|nr:hemolysin family protein [Bacilli bacterium]
MPSDDPLRWLIIICLILIGAFFGASETAYTSCNRIKLKVKADNGNHAARLAVKITDRIDQTLVTVLILNNLLQVAMSTLATILFVGYLKDEGLGSLVSTIVISLIIFLICDSIPKNIARAIPDKVAMINSYLIMGLVFLLWPISIIFYGLNKLLSHIFRMKEEDKVTEEDLSNAVESIEEEGKLDADESEIIHSAIDFDSTFVNEVLTPRERIYGIDITQLTHEKLHEIILHSSYSRIPVYINNIDNIIGVLFVRSYLKKYLENPNISIQETLTPPYFVSPKVKLDDILEGFKKHSTHMAFVRDVSKHLIGMVTMEDVLEELVGETDEKTINALGGRD